MGKDVNATGVGLKQAHDESIQLGDIIRLKGFGPQDGCYMTMSRVDTDLHCEGFTTESYEIDVPVEREDDNFELLKMAIIGSVGRGDAKRIFEEYKALKECDIGV